MNQETKTERFLEHTATSVNHNVSGEDSAEEIFYNCEFFDDGTMKLNKTVKSYLIDGTNNGKGTFVGEIHSEHEFKEVQSN